jgi:hypothetical protein
MSVNLKFSNDRTANAVCNEIFYRVVHSDAPQDMFHGRLDVETVMGQLVSEYSNVDMGSQINYRTGRSLYTKFRSALSSFGLLNKFDYALDMSYSSWSVHGDYS